MSASRTRRQMIQRMGRILRRKRPGVGARFVIVFAQDTMEDPANRLERDGFLDEIERIAEATGSFHTDRFDELERFLDAPGPAMVPEPERLAAYEWAVEEAICGGSSGRSPGAEAAVDAAVDDAVESVALALGDEAAYAVFCFARRARAGALGDAARRRIGPRLPAHGGETMDYLDPELVELPEVANPKAPPKVLSTGQAPLAILVDETGWRMRCTGCGEASPAVRFRWQVLDQTVACRCA
jgi:hypothetical protein